MSSISSTLGLSGVLALRAQIVERSATLSATAPIAAPGKTGTLGAPQATGGFGNIMADALQAVNGMQTESNAAGAAYERGDTQDIAAVMLSRQKAAIAFEATLQTRNRLLSAYRDIMNMPI